MTEKIRAISMYRYRGGAAEKRLYGGQGTVTEFYIYFGDEKEPVKMMGHGPTPGQRKTDAIERARALREKTMQKNNPGGMTQYEENLLADVRAAGRKGLYVGLTFNRHKEAEHLVAAGLVRWREVRQKSRTTRSATDPRHCEWTDYYLVAVKNNHAANPPVLTGSQSKRRVAELRARGCKVVKRKLPSGDTVVLKKCPEGAGANPADDVAPDAGPIAWFALGVLAVAGGVIWYATRPGEAKAAAPPAVPGVPAPAKKCTSFDALSKFKDNIGYNVWYVEAQAVATWLPAKPAYASDPKARAYSQVDCSFFRWTGTAWVADDATNAELAAWVKSSTVGHPISTFVLTA